MTTTTDTIPNAGLATRRRLPRARTVVVAFVVGAILATTAGAFSLAAYSQMHAGKILPGVHVGAVDVSGLDRAAAAERLKAQFASYGQGTLALSVGATSEQISYADLGRRPDMDAMLDAAFAVGRGGSAADETIGMLRTLTNGEVVQPRVTFDRDRLTQAFSTIAAKLDRDPVDGGVKVVPGGFSVTQAVEGATFDYHAASDQVATQLSDTNAPAELRASFEPTVLQPAITATATAEAQAAAVRMTKPIVLEAGAEHWTLSAATVRGWIDFAVVDGVYGPQVDAAAVQKSIAKLGKKIDRSPVNAKFLFGKSNRVVGVTSSSNGRTLDENLTTARIVAVLNARGNAGLSPTESVSPALVTKVPRLTTEVARKSAPLMRPLASWTTYYEVGSHNGFSANITVPSMYINGTVVAPGDWFSYLKTIGPITTARGFKLGGAIINGRSVEGTTLGGGMCSSSTTLFNAALRSGFQIGARRNHYYYIARYPLGLDATVFIDGGYAQDMTFRNDTNYPVLIRAYARPGVIRFTLYSVPTGRTVSLTRPIVKNYIAGYTVTRNTTSLPAGTYKQVEYAANGQDVWVTRTVRDRSGRVIHQETYYSHYQRMIGVILHGVA
jgi:vancomycin resistance protein YoaR